MGLQGRTAVIIAGGTGFGAAISRALAEAGARVMVGDSDETAAQMLAQEIDGLWSEVDPLQNSSLGALAYKVADQLGDIDILVNAHLPALTPKPLDEWSEAEFDAALLAQTKPLFLATRHFVPAMKARRSGVILSILGPAKTTVSWPDAARGWGETAIKAVALELGPFGIRVNALSLLADSSPVLPSFMGGKKNDDRARKLASIPLGRFTLADDLGAAAQFLCSDAASLITGSVIDVNGGAGL